MQIKNEVFDERCKVLHTELKINPKFTIGKSAD